MSPHVRRRRRVRRGDPRWPARSGSDPATPASTLRWLSLGAAEANPLGVALKNQTIRLPIEGTLQRPQIDRQALAKASAEFVRGSAANLLRDTLNKQLDRLFNPPKDEP